MCGRASCTYICTYGRAVRLVCTCLCREAFRTFFGEPSDKDTYIRVSTRVPVYGQIRNCISCSSFSSHVDTLLCTSHLLSPFPGQLILGLPIFLKFAGAAIVALKRWLHAEEVDEDSEAEIDKYFSTIHTPPYVPRLDTFAYTPLTLVEKKPVSCSVKAKPSTTLKKINKGDVMWAKTVYGCVTVLLGSVSRPDICIQSGNQKVHVCIQACTHNLTLLFVLSHMHCQRSVAADIPSPTPTSGASDLSESKAASVDPSTPTTLSSRESEAAGGDEEEESKKKVKLHNCAFCQKEEQEAKSFKRCQK